MRSDAELHFRNDQAFQHSENTEEAESENCDCESDSQSVMSLSLVAYVLHLLKDAVVLMQNSIAEELEEECVHFI